MADITTHLRFRAAVFLILLPVAHALAQMAPDEHAQHHAAPSASMTPSGVVQTTPTSPPVGSTQPSGSMQGMAPGTGTALGGPPAAVEGMAGGMDDMMKGMGTPPQKEVYPTLMALPDGMTPEDRDRVARLSQKRMKEGTASLASGLSKLSDATSNQDYPAMQQATVQMHAGLADFESGIAGQRVVSEGQLPRNIALGWFRREMNLASPTDGQLALGLLGVSPIHLFTMALLVLFALAMFAMYFFKMRRAAALFGRLDPDNKSPPPGPPPSPPSVPKPSGPQSLPSGGASGAPSKEPGAADTGSGPPIAPEVPSPSGTTNQASTVAPTLAIPSPPLTIVSSPAVSPALHEPTQGAAVSSNWKGQLRVGSIIVETPNVKTFRLVSLSNDDILPFTFIPGQFLNVAFWIGGTKMNRSYSISSSPNERQYVDLTIRREPRGAVSRHIDDLIRVGSLIETSGPVGKFTFTGTEADSIVLLSGGVGITPMMSIARYLTEGSWPGDIYFLYTCRTPDDYIFADKMPSLERANPKLHVSVTISRPDGTNWTGFRGRMTKEWLSQVVPNIASRRVHLCGPVSMMDSAKSLLAELGLPADHLKTEAFGLVKPAPAIPGTTPRQIGPPTGPTVTFSKHDKSAKIHMDLQTGDSPPRQTILELSEELGIGIEFSCRVGTCGICKVKMTSGEVDMEVQDALDADDKTTGMILACQAKPRVDVSVEA